MSDLQGIKNSGDYAAGEMTPAAGGALLAELERLRSSPRDEPRVLREWKWQLVILICGVIGAVAMTSGLVLEICSPAVDTRGILITPELERFGYRNEWTLEARHLPQLLTIAANVFIIFYSVLAWRPTRKPTSLIKEFFSRAFWAKAGRRYNRRFVLRRGMSNRSCKLPALLDPEAEPIGELNLSSKPGFTCYWDCIVDEFPRGLRFGKVKSPVVTELASDLAAVSFDLQVRVYRWWWIALICLFFPAALVAVRRGVTTNRFPMRKLVVRVHNQWRIFNGEWQGPEERDLSWLGVVSG